MSPVSGHLEQSEPLETKHSSASEIQRVGAWTEEVETTRPHRSDTAPCASVKCGVNNVSSVPASCGSEAAAGGNLAAPLGFWCSCSPHTFYVCPFCPLYLSKSRVLDILGREKGMRFLTLGAQRERAMALGKLSLFLHAEALRVESL